jgi:DNA-binding NarL/FixJ family response regulator
VNASSIRISSASCCAAAANATPLDALTEREHEILSLMAQGYSNDSICHQLVISRRTVESHVSSVFAKLGIVESPESSRRVLAVLAYLQA